MNYTRTSRALSVNGKRIDISLKDVLTIAETYTIKNARNVVIELQNSIEFWNLRANELEIPTNIIDRINKDFVRLNEV